jgi:acetyl-CoA acetyltransferase
VEYGTVAARLALADAGIEWRDVQFVAGGETVRNGYPGYVAGATFAQALGWQGAEVNTSYAACASGSQALAAARAKILSGQCEVALVVGADTTPKGFLAPMKGHRPEDPDWVRFHLGLTNPTYFALYARRRDQGQERRARRRESQRTLPQAVHRGRSVRIRDGRRPAASAARMRDVGRRRRGRDLQRGVRAAPRARAGAHRRDLHSDAALCERRGRDA